MALHLTQKNLPCFYGVILQKTEILLKKCQTWANCTPACWPWCWSAERRALIFTAPSATAGFGGVEDTNVVGMLYLAEFLRNGFAHELVTAVQQCTPP